VLAKSADAYRSYGFSGGLLDQVVTTIIANREKWVLRLASRASSRFTTLGASHHRVDQIGASTMTVSIREVSSIVKR
jgi:hypothetical protein